MFLVLLLRRPANQQGQFWVLPLLGSMSRKKGRGGVSGKKGHLGSPGAPGAGCSLAESREPRSLHGRGHMKLRATTYVAGSGVLVPTPQAPVRGEAGSIPFHR